MPEFAFICRDKKDAVDLRMATREAHLAFLAEKPDAVLLAGPLLSDDGAPIGSIIIVEAPDRRAAQQMADDDPYAKAGLFETVEVRPYRLVTGKLLESRRKT